MGLVVLVSGGVDSSVITILASRQGVSVFPLFVDYGQICADREWRACVDVHRKHSLPTPKRMNIAGFGRIVPSGLTDASLDIVERAFLPCRNLLFAICGASYACSLNVSCVALGLIDESQAIFPDQTRAFVERAEDVIHTTVGRAIRLFAPLLSLSKAEILGIARELGLSGTYSCHRGTAIPCGQCISCLERIRASESVE